ncbi:MAG: hypothetical protein ACFB50_04115 [Rubrobacteraceae bacterium]
MPSDDAALRVEAISRWHQLLHETPGSDPGLERLRGIVTFGDRRVFTVARPHFVTPVRYEVERLATSLVGSALAKVLAGLHADPSLLEGLGVGEAERELVTIDPGFENVDVLDRYDAFFGKKLDFVEVQGAAPGGIGYHDEAAEAFAQTHVYERFTQDYDARPLLVKNSLMEAFLDTWRDWGGKGDPVIAIVDWKDGLLMPEFEIIRDHLVEAGIQTMICDPRSLSFDGERLVAESTSIDLVYRRLMIQDCLAWPDATKTLVDAARAGAVCLVNPFVSDLIGHKSAFALLTSPEHDFGLGSAERNAVRNHVPWTKRLVRDGDPGAADTVPEGYVLEHRTSLVIKPTHDYGGSNVHLGWEMELGEWEKVVADAVGEDHVVQQRIVAHHEKFALDKPGFPLQDFYLDTDPFMFRGKMVGILTRMSLGGVTNVTQGGSMAPTFLLSPA